MLPEVASEFRAAPNGVCLKVGFPGLHFIGALPDTSVHSEVRFMATAGVPGNAEVRLKTLASSSER